MPAAAQAPEKREAGLCTAPLPLCSCPFCGRAVQPETFARVLRPPPALPQKASCQKMSRKGNSLSTRPPSARTDDGHFFAKWFFRVRRAGMPPVPAGGRTAASAAGIVRPFLPSGRRSAPCRSGTFPSRPLPRFRPVRPFPSTADRSRKACRSPPTVDSADRRRAAFPQLRWPCGPRCRARWRPSPCPRPLGHAGRNQSSRFLQCSGSCAFFRGRVPRARPPLRRGGRRICKKQAQRFVLGLETQHSARTARFPLANIVQTSTVFCAFRGFSRK